MENHRAAGDAFSKAIEEFNSEAKPELTMEFSDKVLNLASEALEMLMLELEEGDSSKEYKALSDEERKAFWKCIADGANDSTQN